MATYCYTNKAGRTIEKCFPMGKAPRSIRVGFVRFRQDTAAKFAGRKHDAGSWPMLCDALGVLPSQAKEAEAHLNSVGVPTTFTREGRCVVRNNGHRNRVMEALGMHDRDACYHQRAKP